MAAKRAEIMARVAAAQAALAAAEDLEAAGKHDYRD